MLFADAGTWQTAMMERKDDIRDDLRNIMAELEREVARHHVWKIIKRGEFNEPKEGQPRQRKNWQDSPGTRQRKQQLTGQKKTIQLEGGEGESTATDGDDEKNKT